MERMQAEPWLGLRAGVLATSLRIKSDLDWLVRSWAQGHAIFLNLLKIFDNRVDADGSDGLEQQEKDRKKAEDERQRKEEDRKKKAEDERQRKKISKKIRPRMRGKEKKNIARKLRMRWSDPEVFGIF